MLAMLSHPRRPQSGHLMCYLNRTYHVLPTPDFQSLDFPLNEDYSPTVSGKPVSTLSIGPGARIQRRAHVFTLKTEEVHDEKLEMALRSSIGDCGNCLRRSPGAVFGHDVAAESTQHR